MMLSVGYPAASFFRTSTSRSSRVNALLSGDINLAASINPRSMKLVQSQSGFELSKTTSGNYTNLNMRLDMAKMEWLLRALAATDCPMSCPHGRPIAMHYSTREILKAFHRI